jgi:hypothetical protein
MYMQVVDAPPSRVTLIDSNGVTIRMMQICDLRLRTSHQVVCLSDLLGGEFEE